MLNFHATTQHHPWTWRRISNQQSRKSNSGYAMTLQKGREATWFQLFKAKLHSIESDDGHQFCFVLLCSCNVGTRLSLVSLYQITPLIQSLRRFRLVGRASWDHCVTVRSNLVKLLQTNLLMWTVTPAKLRKCLTLPGSTMLGLARVKVAKKLKEGEHFGGPQLMKNSWEMLVPTLLVILVRIHQFQLQLASSLL